MYTTQSMACPGIAGLAALVRQYYREINPHSGKRSISEGPLADGRGPSAALVKATLINSCRSLPGVYSYRPDIGRPLEMQYIQEAENPRHVEGFGLPSLNNTLLFQSDRVASDSRSKSLFVMDRYALTDGDAPHVFTFNIASGGTLKCTLVYTDPPGPVSPAFNRQPVLVNNLDLEAEFRCSSGEYENATVQSLLHGTENCPEDYFKNSTWTSASNVDNVEQIPSMTNEPFHFGQAARARLVVKAQNIEMGPQPYALVVSGFGITEAPDGEWTSPNWIPDWTAMASRPQSFKSLQNQVLTGGLTAAGVLFGLFILTILVGCVTSAKKRRRAREEQERATAGLSAPTTPHPELQDHSSPRTTSTRYHEPGTPQTADGSSVQNVT